MLKDISLAVEKDIYHIQVHAGVYAITAPDIPVPIMINHADMARKSIIGKVNRRFAYYNPKLMKELIKGQRLVNMFKGGAGAGRVYHLPAATGQSGQKGGVCRGTGPVDYS